MTTTAESADPMDALSTALSEAYSDNSVASTARAHPRFKEDFKTGGARGKTMKECQRNRRLDFLERQSESRRDAVNYARQLAMGEYVDENDPDAEMDEQQDGSEASRRGGKHYNNRKRPPRPYKDRLMCSEWLVDIPDHTTELTDWLLVPCPVGKRCLVVASKGRTCAYSKSGYPMAEFYSALPGGSRQTTKRGDYSLLDCVYSAQQQTYYVLDMLCLNSQPYLDSETEFRFFWLTSQLAERPELGVKSPSNQAVFRALPHVACADMKTIQDFMAKDMPFSDELDGLLFYHKLAHYHAGVTPLVGWLKPFMLPEVLGVDVPETYRQNNKSTADFIVEYNDERIRQGKPPHVSLKDRMQDDDVAQDDVS